MLYRLLQSNVPKVYVEWWYSIIALEQPIGLQLKQVFQTGMAFGMAFPKNRSVG